AMALALERGDRPLPAGTEGLPRAFLQSLRTLFDILDDRRRGYVHLREIESRWRGAEARELPAGVMEGLRRAAPASGDLTFERVSGGRRSGEKPPSPCCAEERRRKSNGQREPGRGQPRGRGSAWSWHRGRCSTRCPGMSRWCWLLCACPDAMVWGGAWPEPGSELALAMLQGFVPGGDAKATGQSQGDSGHSGTGDARRHPRGRAEHRRHTITNGVDFSMLKHMKELEQEKDFLLQGLELVECAREWYHQHIQLMQERQRLLGKNKTSVDSAPEGSQSHLGHLVPKLQEVNRCLGDLLSTAGKAANPSSALSRLVPVVSPASAGSQQAINMLKEQNRLLTKEVTDKSERITQLEQEKSALIKQLFEARAHNNHETSQLDSTFI
ncbi:SAPC2 protein, partial [Amazona guildingii]|nr:SAPC2 protein [Amazona guildingii]